MPVENFTTDFLINELTTPGPAGLAGAQLHVTKRHSDFRADRVELQFMVAQAGRWLGSNAAL